MTEEKKANEGQPTDEEKKTEDKKVEDKKVEEKKTDDTSCGSGICEKGKGGSLFVWIIVIVLILGAIIFFQQKKDGSSEAKAVSDKTSEEVSAAASELINEQLVMPGTEVEVGEITEESGLYKIELTVAGQEITSYMTKDMTKFIPQLIDTKEVEEMEGEDGEQPAAPVAEVTTKSDKPEVELFVMSYCPYGTQMEKGFLPAVDALGNTVDAKLKFVDYAMHGEKEINENLRQYCIQKNEPQKINKYLDCFLASTEGSDAEAKVCITQTQVNTTLLGQCMTSTDAEYKVTELAKDEASYVSGQFPQFNVDKDDVEKYGVQGSPTLVVNGETVQVGRDSASILAVICSGFNEQPEACQTELSSVSPAPGFGEGVDTTGASADADCGA